MDPQFILYLSSFGITVNEYEEAPINVKNKLLSLFKSNKKHKFLTSIFGFTTFIELLEYSWIYQEI